MTQDGSTNEILDINEAMQKINQAKQKDAEGPVASEESGESTESNTTESQGQIDTNVSEEPGTDTSNGGSTATAETTYQAPQINYGQGLQSLQEQAHNMALQQAADQLKQQQLKPASMADLQQRNTQTGEVSFINPDTKKPFTSSNPRSEAQAWIQSYNQELADYAQSLVDSYEPRMQEEMEAPMRVMEFGPVYDAMDTTRQKWFDQLIEPYEIRKDGSIIGYSCDLFGMQKSMEQSIAYLTAQQEAITSPQTAEVNNIPAKPPKRPVADIKSSSGASETQQGPKDLNEALKMYNELNKKGKK